MHCEVGLPSRAPNPGRAGRVPGRSCPAAHTRAPRFGQHIVLTKRPELLEEGAPTQKTDVPAVDLPNVVEQMRKERDLFRLRDGMGSYQELARYGLASS